MSGREYKIHRMEAVGSSAHATEGVEYPFCVTEGIWVAHASSGYYTSTDYHEEGEDLWSETESSERKFELVGSAQRIVLSRSHRRDSSRLSSYSTGGSDVLLISREPFGVIFWNEENGEPDGGKYLRRARQIHKGEEGQYGPDIPMPQLAREAPSLVSECTSKRDRKRGYDGWARLTEVAELAGLEPRQVLLEYWDFVDAREHRGRAEVRIEIIIAFSRDQIHKQVVSPELRCRLNRQQVAAMAADSETRWHDLWVRRGFARTVLTLRHFGYAPKAELQPA